MSRSAADFGLLSYIALTFWMAWVFPQSVLAFLCFEISLLLLCYLPVHDKVRIATGGLVLVIARNSTPLIA